MLVETENMREAVASYIGATYHLSNPRLVELRHDLLTGGGVAQEPFVESTPTYVGDRRYADLSIATPLRGFFSQMAGDDAGRLIFDPPYAHQAEALEAALSADAGGRAIVVTTGTGSGKTESFLLPVVGRLAEEASTRRANFAERAVRALLLYPMNALVNDQLGRLRSLLGSRSVSGWFSEAAGRPAKFGRYTGRTLYPGGRSDRRDRERLKTLDLYLKMEDAARSGDPKARDLVRILKDKGRWPAKPDSAEGAFDGLRGWYGRSGAHWSDANGEPLRAVERPQDPELVTRHEIQAAPPDLLVTNYSMLEYMLLRPIERDIFGDTRSYYEAHPEERFFLVLDEAHLYRGANGTEVAYLVRRLLDRLGLPPSRVVFIATSASFSNPAAAAEFVADLTGIPSSSVTTLQGSKQSFAPAGPGDVDLGAGLAEVPLAKLQSADRPVRAEVLSALIGCTASVNGDKVKLKRVDSAPGTADVTVTGLDRDGRRIVEAVAVTQGTTVSTTGAFILVEDVGTLVGRVSVERRFPLGEAHAGGMEWQCDDLPAALYASLRAMPVVGRLRNATSGAVSPNDVVLGSAGAAWPLSRLPSLLFPEAPRDIGARAVDALLELASLARPSPQEAPLLPARVHLLFRGLPGIWACMDPDCTDLPADKRGGPTGAIFSEPRRACGCGSQVYELHSCRSCGLAVASAHAGAPAGVEHLWQDNGAIYTGDTGTIRPVHVCLEDPVPVDPAAVRAAYLDAQTGRIDGQGTALRDVWLAPLLGGGLFQKCPRCGAKCGEDESWGISDLTTKGDQPFQELIAVQVLEQPPRPESTTALQGRKALVFSDGRQTASRLAGTLKTFSFRDSLRPLFLAGMRDLAAGPYSPSLDDAPLAVALGAARRGVRLRPAGDHLASLERYGSRAKDLFDDEDVEAQEFADLSIIASERAPQSVFAAIYLVLQDDQTGFEAVALATLRPKLTKKEASKLRSELNVPTINGMGEDEVRSAVVGLWLWSALRKRAVKLRGTPAGIESDSRPPVLRKWNGSFPQEVQKILNARGLRTWLKGSFVPNGLPVLKSIFCDADAGAEFFLRGNKVALAPEGEVRWVRCERCTAVSPANPLIATGCGHCGGTTRIIDPSSDAVFVSRKSFYRRLWERLCDDADPYVPHQLIAEEHSAALNDSGLANAMSRNEAYELRFQDIAIEQDGQAGTPIDILSCTTTMEVGIDIGGLTAVAMRNVPPGRANYQQRAGRAGRRGAGLSTVVMFCGADSHDQTFFRDPGPIVAGPSPDPILNLDNPVIARRQAYAYLMGRFQLERLDVNGNAASDVFSSLGTVGAFLSGEADAFSLSGLGEWIRDGKAALSADVRRLFASSCSDLDPDALLDGFKGTLLSALSDGETIVPVAADTGDDAQEGRGDDIEEPESEHAGSESGKLLDRLFDAGLLPKYAFPTDVATFSVFEASTNAWRPKRRYSPQQGLNTALSQYAPGREVWVDGQRYASLGIYAEREEDRLAAYREHRLYYQCTECGYADLLDKDQGYPDQTRDCPACDGRGKLGPARRWVRPPGFAHPPALDALPPQFDPGPPLRATSATLALQQSDSEVAIGAGSWPSGTGWEATSDTKALVVTNRGSLGAVDYGFNYCALCGRTEPADFDSTFQQLRGSTHDRPRPTRAGEPATCTGRPFRIVLGNEFRTDVVVFRLAVPLEWRLDPNRAATRIAARSAVEALRRAACIQEDLEPGDVDGDYRFAPSSGENRFIDLYLYDQAAGGAGFVRAASRDPLRLVGTALALLDGCSCDDSCYQCLRSYKNRFEHALFDRRIGADLLRACFYGTLPTIDEAREDMALQRLQTDLAESGAATELLEGALREANGRIICIAHPFLPDQPSSARAARLAAPPGSVTIDILLVLRALPVATAQAVGAASGSEAPALVPSPHGVPVMSPEEVVAGTDSAASQGARYEVAGAEPGDFLFRLNAHVMGGGTPANVVAKGTLCLFRSHSGEPEKQAFYLMLRVDGHAFAATGAGWTVGLQQATQAGGAGLAAVRVRYRAAPDRLECASEVVPASAIHTVAGFVKKVG